MMKECFELQKQVDIQIEEKIGVLFSTTIGDRKIAFGVELCELANEIGFFKYWKTSHKLDYDRIKDEWADCFAFLNSLAITYGLEDEIIKDFDMLTYSVNQPNVSTSFKQLQFNKLYDATDILSAYVDLFKIGYKVGFKKEELIEAYKVKSAENIRRAQEGY